MPRRIKPHAHAIIPKQNHVRWLTWAEHDAKQWLSGVMDVQDEANDDNHHEEAEEGLLERPALRFCGRTI